MSYYDMPNTASDEFYFDKNGNVVYTEKYLRQRGYCCGKKCKHCPYKPKYQKGNTKL